MSFFDSSGFPVFLKNGGDYVGSLSYSIGPNGVQKLVLSEALLPVVSGYISIVSADQNPTPAAIAILSHTPGAVTLWETSVPVTMGTAFRMFAEKSGEISPELAVVNPNPTSGVVSLSLTNPDGEWIAGGSWTLQGGGQLTGTLDSLIPSLANQSVQGLLRITTDLPSLSVTGFRKSFSYRQSTPDLLVTTIPPVLEDDVTSQDRVFPQFVNGENYTTQFILYSGTAGQMSFGELMFVRSDGTSFLLDIH
jgi:hypothetical protein